MVGRNSLREVWSWHAPQRFAVKYVNNGVSITVSNEKFDRVSRGLLYDYITVTWGVPGIQAQTME